MISGCLIPDRTWVLSPRRGRLYQPASEVRPALSPRLDVPYSDAYKAEVIKWAVPAPPLPPFCDKCFGDSAVINALCFREDVAGQYAQICSECNALPVMYEQIAPRGEDLEAAFQIRRQDILDHDNQKLKRDIINREQQGLVGLQLGLGGRTNLGHAKRKTNKLGRAEGQWRRNSKKKGARKLSGFGRILERVKRGRNGLTVPKFTSASQGEKTSQADKIQGVDPEDAEEGDPDLHAKEPTPGTVAEEREVSGCGVNSTVLEDADMSVVRDIKGKGVARDTESANVDDGDKSELTTETTDKRMGRKLTLHLYYRDGERAERCMIYLGVSTFFRFCGSLYLHLLWARLVGERVDGPRSAFEVWRAHSNNWELTGTASNIKVFKGEDHLVVRKLGVENMPGFCQTLRIAVPGVPEGEEIRLGQARSPPSRLEVPLRPTTPSNLSPSTMPSSPSTSGEDYGWSGNRRSVWGRECEAIERVWGAQLTKEEPGTPTASSSSTTLAQNSDRQLSTVDNVPIGALGASHPTHEVAGLAPTQRNRGNTPPMPGPSQTCSRGTLTPPPPYQARGDAPRPGRARQRSPVEESGRVRKRARRAPTSAGSTMLQSTPNTGLSHADRQLPRRRANRSRPAFHGSVIDLTELSD